MSQNSKEWSFKKQCSNHSVKCFCEIRKIGPLSENNFGQEEEVRIKVYGVKEFVNVKKVITAYIDFSPEFLKNFFV